jgi:hypothetical protein
MFLYCRSCGDVSPKDNSNEMEHVNVSYNNPQRELGLLFTDIIMVGKNGTY